MRSILFLTQYDEHGASSRHCVYAFLRYFPKEEFEITLRPLFDKNIYDYAGSVAEPKNFFKLLKTIIQLSLLFLNRYRHLLDCNHFDVVAVQKDVLPFGAQWLLKMRAKKILFMTDDPIWVRNPGALGNIPVLGTLVSAYRRHLVFSIVRASSVVFVENSKMAEALSHLGTRIEIIPSAIDTVAHAVKTKIESPLAFGWVGSPGSVYLLKRILPWLEKLSEKHAFELYNISSTELESRNIRIHNVQWTQENELETLQKFHIGLMPMDTTDFSQLRTSRKWLIYSLGEIATLAQETPLNRMLMQDDHTVAFYRDEKSFMAKAEKLIQDSVYRRNIALRASTEVKDKYDYRKVAEKFVREFQP